MNKTDIFFLALVFMLFSVTRSYATASFRLKLAATAGVLLWLGLLTKLASEGWFNNFSSTPPRIALAFLLPFVFAIVTALASWAKPLPHSFSIQFLIGLQTFRVAMELILWALYREGRVPIQMTFEGRNVDIFVGLTAPLVAYLYHTGKIGRTFAICWNIGGLLILANIVGTAILSIPTPFRIFHNEPANTIVASWPYVWLPGFVVPVAYTAHFYCLKRLMTTKALTS